MTLLAKENHPANISARNAALKGTFSSQTSVTAKGILSQMITWEKIAREAQQWPQRKYKVVNLTVVTLLKRESSGLTKQQTGHTGD